MGCTIESVFEVSTATIHDIRLGLGIDRDVRLAFGHDILACTEDTRLSDTKVLSALLRGHPAGKYESWQRIRTDERQDSYNRSHVAVTRYHDDPEDRHAHAEKETWHDKTQHSNLADWETTPWCRSSEAHTQSVNAEPDSSGYASSHEARPKAAAWYSTWSSSWPTSW